MPLRHTDKGWMWGSRGPFPTKSKALSVARAAYASGYREGIDMEQTICAQFVGTLLHSATITHFMHLQSRNYAEHQALGSFYEEIVELADGLAESIQGKYGIIEGYGPTFATTDADAMDYLNSLSEYVDETRVNMPQDSEIQNDIDSIQTLINSTVYKLTYLS